MVTRSALFLFTRWSTVRFSPGTLRPERFLNTQARKEEGAPEPEKPEEDVKSRILEASLPFVKSHGWSTTAISAGAESIGFPGVVHGIFPGGSAELINYFYRKSNEALLEKLKSDDEALRTDPSRKLSEQVVSTQAIETRLRMLIPYKEHWPQALAMMTLPPNVPTALANLLTLIDDICYYAGDRSVDMSWYTKRLALAGVYKTTELFMLQDKSEDHQNTWEFLNRRMDEMVQIHGILAQSEEASRFAKDFASSAFVTARNILGISWNR